MVEMSTDIKDTKGGTLTFRKSPFKEMGILSEGGGQAVYWYEEDTDEVIGLIRKLKEVI